MTEGFYKSDTFKTSNDDTWTTPRDFFDRLNAEFDFGLDAAALQSSTLVPDNWYGPDHPDPAARDALRIDWNHNSRGKPIWLNPPYGRSIKDWMRKANEVASGGGTVVCLVPARTDTNWWWDSCIHHEVRFIKGRLKFGNQPNAAPFPSAVIVMRGNQ
jgi:site-specific DNA-methyltransferase (adenine-specific)